MMCVSDSLTVVQYINNGVSIHHRYSNEIEESRRYLSLQWDIKISHGCWEGNQCADFLAKMGASCSDNVEVLLHDAPAGLLGLLANDATGTSFIRK